MSTSSTERRTIHPAKAISDLLPDEPNQFIGQAHPNELSTTGGWLRLAAPAELKKALSIAYPILLMQQASPENIVKEEKAIKEIGKMRKLANTALVTPATLTNPKARDILTTAGVTDLAIFGTEAHVIHYDEVFSQFLNTKPITPRTSDEIRPMLAEQIGRSPRRGEIFAECLQFAVEALKGNNSIVPAFIFILPPSIIETREKPNSKWSSNNEKTTVSELERGLQEMITILQKVDPKLKMILPPILFAAASSDKS